MDLHQHAHRENMLHPGSRRSEEDRRSISAESVRAYRIGSVISPDHDIHDGRHGSGAHHSSHGSRRNTQRLNDGKAQMMCLGGWKRRRTFFEETKGAKENQNVDQIVDEGRHVDWKRRSAKGKRPATWCWHGERFVHLLVQRIKE